MGHVKQGGKSGLSTYIVPKILEVYKERQDYLEPFIGAGWVMEKMVGISGKRFGSDLHSYQIALLRAVQAGWKPPTTVTERQYAQVKQAYHRWPSLLPDYFIGYIGYLSWAGKWWDGYRRGENRNYAAESSRALTKGATLIKDVLLTSCDYGTWKPNNMCIYCDIPYKGTTSYDGVAEFDHERFYKTMSQWVLTNTVLLSEQSTPPIPHTLLWEKEYIGGIRKGTEKPTEKLFLLHPERGAW